MGQPLLGALAPQVSDTALHAAGFRAVIVAAAWTNIEPSDNVYSASAIADVQARINAAHSAGLSVSLDIGIQYPPAWLTSQQELLFVNQYGDRARAPLASGHNVVNAITNTTARWYLERYMKYLAQHLTGVDSIRVGGGAYNELRYPLDSLGSQPDSYWFYDAASQALLPTDVRGWKPGTGTVQQATTFLRAYLDAMSVFGVWLTTVARQQFPKSHVLLLLPGWGVRPGQAANAASALLVGQPNELKEGLDWATMLPQLPRSTKVVAYSTYVDATQGGPTNPNPIDYIYSLLPNGLRIGGESTGNGQTTSEGLQLMMHRSATQRWYMVNWFFNNQPQSPREVADAYRLR